MYIFAGRRSCLPWIIFSLFPRAFPQRARPRERTSRYDRQVASEYRNNGIDEIKIHHRKASRLQIQYLPRTDHGDKVNKLMTQITTNWCKSRYFSLAVILTRPPRLKLMLDSKLINDVPRLIWKCDGSLSPPPLLSRSSSKCVCARTWNYLFMSQRLCREHQI